MCNLKEHAQLLFVNIEQLFYHFYLYGFVDLHKISKPSNFIKKIKLKDESYIEYYENLQIRKDKNDRTIVQYIQTTTGRVLLNYTIQTTLNIEL